MAKKTVDDEIGLALGASTDELQTGSDGKVLMSFLRGLAGFFTTARALEETASTKLARAQAFQLPTNADEDVELQTFVKGVNEDDKSIDTHWEICGVAHRFHRRLTEARDRGKTANKESRRLATKLHNDYTEAERRRVAEEAERERQAREAAAREEQAREAARLDAEALEREQASPDLSAREAQFVDYIYGRMLPTQAAQRCGYKDPAKVGERLLGLVKIQNALQAKRDAAALREQAEATRKQPVEVRSEPAAKPDIKKAPGAHDRTTWGAEILSTELLGKAIIASLTGHDYGGVDAGIVPIANAIEIIQAGLKSDEVKTLVNKCGNQLHEKVDAWPGVRHTKKTGIV
jgi:hypothetical protein